MRRVGPILSEFSQLVNKIGTLLSCRRRNVSKGTPQSRGWSRTKKGRPPLPPLSTPHLTDPTIAAFSNPLRPQHTQSLQDPAVFPHNLEERARSKPYGRRSRSPDGKGNLRLARSPPGYGLQDGQTGQDSEVPNRLRMRFRKDAILRWMAEKSMHVQQVRKDIESGVNGEVDLGGKPRRSGPSVR
jgi:hypothetical protein